MILSLIVLTMTRKAASGFLLASRTAFSKECAMTAKYFTVFFAFVASPTKAFTSSLLSAFIMPTMLGTWIASVCLNSDFGSSSTPVHEKQVLWHHWDAYH